ncbi:hypothetical protein CL616_00820 [archaeon]|nr:hypothetical protein [archaeon]|tara:strand:- start:1459 stop:2079 length:621 start_codon:yes stop_codon:yes gene_type:complete
MYKEKLGLVHVYTGNSKGKTTLAMGMAVRAAGQNLKVHIVQFLKGGYYTGEFLAIANYIPQINFEQYGKHCIKEKQQMKLTSFKGVPEVEYYREDVECDACRYCFLGDDEEKQLALQAYKRAKELVQDEGVNVVVLDEIVVCVAKEILDIEDVLYLIKNKHKHCELILTGRYAPMELFEHVNLVTEMKSIKHPFDEGISARKGIEY